MREFHKLLVYAGLLAGCLGCGGSDATSPAPHVRPRPLFTLLSADSTGVAFSNQLTEGPNTNILVYEYFYNGGGVATGDFNGDGHVDLYFTANMADNKLYLGDGAFHFRDVTRSSGTAGRPGPWTTGVSLVDINADGRLDLYVSYSGMLPEAKRRNQLFVNQGNTPEGVPQFREEAAAYGLDSPAFSNQGYFFDYDGDGDLDCLLLNHNPKSLPLLSTTKTRMLLATPDAERGLRLYRNTANKFTDVTEAAGLNGSELSYGLGLALSDLDADGDTDFYLSNDYEVPDYLYVNNGDGTFTDRLGDLIGHTSHFSMGSDVADVNRDGRPDIFTLDMLPAGHERRQLLTPDDNQAKLEQNLENGFHYQTMRNMLHLNRGGAGYAEIGRLAGVATTDWSWSALFADFDHDGYQDLHVTNGYVRDYTNQDFIKFMDDYVSRRGRLVRADLKDIIAQMKASDVSNYVFRGVGEGRFADVTGAWGLHRPSNSTGAAYADLDGDGDLDLVVNNINQPAFLYRNDRAEGHSVRVRLIGPPGNPLAIGSRVTLTTSAGTQMRELFPNRGYLSSVQPRLHFGIGAGAQVQRLDVTWPDGTGTTLTGVPPDEVTVLDWKDRKQRPGESRNTVREADPVAVFQPIPSDLDHTDRRSGSRDFDRQPLLPRQLSDPGPELLLSADGRRVTALSGGEAAVRRRTARSPDGRYAFVGGGPVPGRYPESAANTLRERTAAGKYVDRTTELSEGLRDLPLVTAATWSDLDRDGREELIVVGEYLPVTVFTRNNDRFENRTAHFLPDAPAGWWNAITAADLNGDGRPDLIAGNQGLNNLFTATPEEPVELWYGDFDDNGSVDPFFTYYIDGERQLDATRDEALTQLAPLRSRFPSYTTYAEAGPEAVLGDQLTKGSRLQATELRSCVYLSTPDGTWTPVYLPLEAQYAPVHTVTPLDFDGDGDLDLLLCGNESLAKQRWGKSDANAGCLLRNEGSGSFTYVDQQRSGLALRGDVRSVVRRGNDFYFGVRDGAVVAYRLSSDFLSR